MDQIIPLFIFFDESLHPAISGHIFNHTVRSRYMYDCMYHDFWLHPLMFEHSHCPHKYKNICKINIGQCGHMLTGGWALGGQLRPSSSQPFALSYIWNNNTECTLTPRSTWRAATAPSWPGSACCWSAGWGCPCPWLAGGAGCCAVLELVCCCWRGAAAGPHRPTSASLHTALVTTLVWSYNISMLLASHSHIHYYPWYQNISISLIY